MRNWSPAQCFWPHAVTFWWRGISDQERRGSPDSSGWPGWLLPSWQKGICLAWFGELSHDCAPHAHTHTHRHTHARTHTHVRARAHTHTHTYTHTYTRMHARTHACMHTRIRTHTLTFHWKCGDVCMHSIIALHCFANHLVYHSSTPVPGSVLTWPLHFLNQLTVWILDHPKTPPYCWLSAQSSPSPSLLEYRCSPSLLPQDQNEIKADLGAQSPAETYLIVQYAKPNSSADTVVEVAMMGDDRHVGYAVLPFCPSRSGCRAIVSGRNLESAMSFPLSDSCTVVQLQTLNPDLPVLIVSGTWWSILVWTDECAPQPLSWFCYLCW